MKSLLIILLCFANCQAEPLTYLDHFKEPPFDKKSREPLERYRMVLSPTFSNPYLFRFTVTGSQTGSFVVKRLSGKGGYEKGTLELEQTFLIQGDEFKQLAKAMRDSRIRQPYGEKNPDDFGLLSGVDGTEVSFEIATEKDQFSIMVWSPESYPYALRSFDIFKTPEFSSFHKDFSPFFQACYAFLKTARPRINWSQDAQEEYQDYVKASAAYLSPSFDKALALLNPRSNDAFGKPEPTPKATQEALALLEKAITEAPGNFEVHRILADQYLNLGENLQAASHAVMAARLDPTNNQLLANSGEILAKTGQVDEARKVLSELVKRKCQRAPELAKLIELSE